MITTFAKNQLDKSLNKTWGALDFANEHTDGGFAKLTQGKKDMYTRKASIKVKDRNGIETETGWKSMIEGVVADSPGKVRGDRVDLLVFEEAGSNPVLRTSYIQGEALIYIGGTKFGIRLCGGTGGDKGEALASLREMYYKPTAYDVLPFYHNYTPTGEWVYTGYFIPSYIGAVTKFGKDKLNVERQLLDDRGYCLWENYKEQLDTNRGLLIDSPKALHDHCAEYCYTAEEAFALEGNNKFNQIVISEQLTKIRALKQCPPIDEGYFTFTYKSQQRKVEYGNISDIVWHSDKKYNKVRILEHPMWTDLYRMQRAKQLEDTDMEPEPIVNKSMAMYVAGVDGIDIGAAQTSDYTKDPSDFCIVIYKRVYGLRDPMVVATYKDRPQDLREAYETAIALAMYYNALINIEATRMSFCSWAKSKKFLNFFMKRPRATYPDINKIKTTQYGTPGTDTVINHQTDLIRDYIEDYGYNIWFEDILQELERYSDEQKRKFDYVAALGMCMLADEELQDITPRAVVDTSHQFRDIGYYIDEKGYRRFGVIPDKNNQNPVLSYANDERTVRESYPRMFFRGVW